MQTLKVQRDYRSHVLYHYNRHAYFYDMMEFFRRGTRRKAMILSGWRSGERILNLCTGSGEMALVFASQGENVVGPDIARGMLRRAVNKSLGTLSAWVEMDATHPAIRDVAFEISIISLALHHMPVRIQVQVLMELSRVTGRRIVIIEPDVPVNQRWSPVWSCVASIIDESEYMHEWVSQEFIHTCRTASLNVESVHGAAFGLHPILLCQPQLETLGS
jgi:ubiquinone/menaquinone biosynthesis C-methylase UbiE